MRYFTMPNQAYPDLLNSPIWLQPILQRHPLVVITSSLTETKPIEVLAAKHGIVPYFETMSMGSTLNRERFNELCEVVGRKQLPLIFWQQRFIGGLYELQQQFGN